MKHRHKWELEYVRDSIIGKGLLYFCKCGNCLEFNKKTARIKEVRSAYQKYIDFLEANLKRFL